MLNLDQLIANIKIEEGSVLSPSGRSVVYDDANARPIVAGYKVIGNPTIGYGRLLTAGNGISEKEAETLLWNDLTQAASEAATLPGWGQCNDARQLALVDMVFNMGLASVQTFHTFLGFLAASQFDKAASDLRQTLWYRQVGSRGERLADIFETGNWIVA